MHTMDYPPDPSQSRPGLSAELYVAANLVHLGYYVAIPLIQTPRYDLIIDNRERLYRVQVKWAQHIPARIRKHGRGDRAHYMVSLKKQKYTPTDFDLLVMVCHIALVYYIPMVRLCEKTGRVPWQVRIKDANDAGIGTRLDSKEAIERWEPYRNKLVLP